MHREAKEWTHWKKTQEILGALRDTQMRKHPWSRTVFLLLATNGALGKQLWWMDVSLSQDVNVVLLMKTWVSQMFPQIFFLFLFYILLWKLSNSYKSRQNEVMNPMCHHQASKIFNLCPHCASSTRPLLPIPVLFGANPRHITESVNISLLVAKS